MKKSLLLILMFFGLSSLQPGDLNFNENQEPSLSTWQRIKEGFSLTFCGNKQLISRIQNFITKTKNFNQTAEDLNSNTLIKFEKTYGLHSFKEFLNNGVEELQNTQKLIAYAKEKCISTKEIDEIEINILIKNISISKELLKAINFLEKHDVEYKLFSMEQEIAKLKRESEDLKSKLKIAEIEAASQQAETFRLKAEHHNYKTN